MHLGYREIFSILHHFSKAHLSIFFILTFSVRRVLLQNLINFPDFIVTFFSVSRVLLAQLQIGWIQVATICWGFATDRAEIFSLVNLAERGRLQTDGTWLEFATIYSCLLIVMVVNTIECVVGKLFGVFKPAFGHIRLEGHDHFTLEVRYLHFLAKFSSSGLGTYFLINR